MITRRSAGTALLVGAAFLIGGCRGGEREVANAFNWTHELSPGSTIHLSTTSGSVTVHGTNEPRAHVHGTKRWRRGRERDVRFVVSHEGNDVYVCAIWTRRGGRCGDERYKPRPPRWLTMFSLIRRRSDMQASLTVGLPPGVAVDASTVNGRVVVTEAAGDVRANTVNGEIRASTMGAGSLSLRSVNGNIRARAASLSDDARIELETVNGSVRAEMPPELDAVVQLRTVNGHITTDFPLSIRGSASNRQVDAVIGEGGARRIELKTVNGSVELRKS